MEIVRVRFIDTKNKGCENAPAAILHCFKEINCKENGSLIDKSKLRFEEIHVDLDNKEEAEYLILENAKEIFERNFKSFFIGGDSSMLVSLIRAFEQIEKDSFILVMDAHAGCQSSSSSSLSLLDRGWLKRLVEEKKRNILLLGTRSYDLYEKEFLKQNRIISIDMSLLREDREGICELIMERAHTASGFFIIIDLDVVDPAFAPGVNSIEPGGLASGELIYFMQRLQLLKNFKGAALIGVNPDKDINEMSVKLSAKLLAEMV